jgi:hypothetical protein
MARLSQTDKDYDSKKRALHATIEHLRNSLRPKKEP